MPADTPPERAISGIEARGEMTLADYWHERVALHHEDNYAGVPMLKFPEDLRMYERLLWKSRPEVVIEVGCLEGGSALWLRDRMAALAGYGGPTPRVICIDTDIDAARSNLAKADPDFESEITLVEGDILSAGTVSLVRDAVGEASCMVIEDSAHTYETTLASLKAFGDLVPDGGFFVVEDGYVDIEWMRPSADWPRGVQQAIDDWLEGEGSDFTRRRDLEAYILTCHPGGILQRSSHAGPGPIQGERTGSRVTNPDGMSGYANTVRRLEARVAEEESRVESTFEALLASEKARRQLEEERDAAFAHLERANEAISAMKRSVSWRLTSPLRRLKKLFK